jgi:hypothetical protein
MFKIVINQRNETFIIKEFNDKTYHIPQDLENKDYQEYLAWVAEGNIAEEVTQ